MSFFKEEDIKTKVGSYKCPQRECGRVVKEMVETLLGGQCIIKKEVRCSSLKEALQEIDNLLTEKNLVVIWPSSGFVDPQCTIPVWHSYIVFSTKPLKSFTAWESGIVFYDEKSINEAIEGTINSVPHNKVITIHQYERKVMDKRIENEESKKAIWRTFEKEFNAQKRLLEHTVNSMDLLEKDPEFHKKIETYIGMSTYALFLKGLNTFWATYALCREGFGSEALITVRSLFNLVIDSLWIAKDGSGERAERYLAFDIVFRKQRVDVMKSYSPKLPAPPDYAEIEKQYNLLKTRFNLKGTRKDTWTDMTIRDRATEVGKEKDYAIIYSYLSEIEHSGASSLAKYVEADETTLKLHPGPSTALIYMALILNYGNFYTLLKHVHSSFNLSLPLEEHKKSFYDLYGIFPPEP